MGLFRHDDEQDANLDEIERRVRRMTEQISELSVDLSQTRKELLKTRAVVADTLRAIELDPVFEELSTRRHLSRTCRDHFSDDI